MKRHLLRLWSGLVPMFLGAAFAFLVIGGIAVVYQASKWTAAMVITLFALALVFAYLTGDFDE